MPRKPTLLGLIPDFWNAMNHTTPKHEFGSVLLFTLLFNYLFCGLSCFGLNISVEMKGDVF